MTAAAVSTPRSVRSNRFRFGPLWLAAPGLAFLLIFFLVPVARLMGLSLEDADTGAMTASHYARIFETDVYFRVLLITFRIAGLTTLFSLLLGYPLAYWLSRLPDQDARHDDPARDGAVLDELPRQELCLGHRARTHRDHQPDRPGIRCARPAAGAVAQ
ncbi:hypothetical protein [Ensifer canadensis]